MHQRPVPSFCCLFAGLSLLASVAVAQAPLGAPAAPAPAPNASSSTVPAADDASSYSIGLVFGSQLYTSGLDHTLVSDAVIRGFKEGLAGKALDTEDKDRAMQLMRTGREAVAARNRAAAHEFLQNNSAAPGVNTTASGLQYRVFDAGNTKAAAPTLADRVTVNYRGRLLDGTEFDNSDKHSQSATFGLEGIIKGWREALLLMKPGAKWRLFVPPELAYDIDSPPNIPPGALLIFDLELLRVEPPAHMGAPGGRGSAAPRPMVPKRPANPASETPGP